MASFLLVAAIVFMVAVGLTLYIYIGERRDGHARDDD